MGYEKCFLPATSGTKTQWLLVGSKTIGCVQEQMYEPSVFTHCPPTHEVSSRHSLMSAKKKITVRGLGTSLFCGQESHDIHEYHDKTNMSISTKANNSE